MKIFTLLFHGTECLFFVDECLIDQNLEEESSDPVQPFSPDNRMSINSILFATGWCIL
jgi:hypothetical protein